MRGSKLFVIAIIAAAVAAFFAFDLGRFLSLDYFKAQQAALEAFAGANPLQAAAAFLAIYVVATGLSLPGATILTLAGGAIFGLVWGVVLVSFASTIGATLAFLASRFLLRDWVQAKFGDKLKPINEGVARQGAFYLFALRLVPAFPFFVVNLVMGLTPIRAATYYWVSQAGMLAGTVVYVYAGTQLAQVTSLKGILSPGLLGAFVLLGVFPFIARRLVAGIKARKVYAKWPRPAAFDRNVVVIGAGSAGLVTSYIAAAVKAKVTLVERHKMGGDRLNTGCVPSKALIRSARFLSHVKRAREFGMRGASAEPWTVDVELADGGRETITTKNIVIAAGARPFVPPIPGLADVKPLTSDNIWELRKLPARLEDLGISVTKQRTVEVNEFLETTYPNIFACGDVAGPYQFTHTAAHMAWYASVNALFGRLRKFKVDYSVVPWATFTEPEVARVGLNEQEAKEKGIAHQVTVYGIDDLDRAIADGEAHGFVKVLTIPGSDRILGATIVGEHAGDLIAEFVAAMRHGLGLAKILGTIHIYPTLTEANKYAAGNWKRSTVTRGQMSFLAAFHGWTRGVSGLGSVLGYVSALLGDKRPFHPQAEAHCD